MSGKIFIDTNVLVYIYDRDTQKQARALALIEKADDPVISDQVLMEFCNVMIKKFHIPPEDVRVALNDFRNNFEIRPLSAVLFDQALVIHKRYHYSYYDSLILAAAMEAGCDEIYTEDMCSGQKIKNIRILNPFK